MELQVEGMNMVKPIESCGCILNHVTSTWYSIYRDMYKQQTIAYTLETSHHLLLPTMYWVILSNIFTISQISKVHLIIFHN